MSETINVGGEKQLFIDGKFIESSEGVTLTANPPYQTGEALVVTDQPWERDGQINAHGSVIREDGSNGPVIRLWYDLLRPPGVPGNGYRVTAYAESKDGIHFDKPILGLVEKDGSKDNNIVMPDNMTTMGRGGASIGIDENPECPPEERYKSWAKLYTLSEQNKTEGTDDQGIPDYSGRSRTFYSADGIHWKVYVTVPTGLRAHDTMPSWFWDSRIGRYIGYSREKFSFSPDGFNVRMVGYNESDDMLHWENLILAIKPDEMDLTCAPLPRTDAVLSKSVEAVKHSFGSHMDIYGASAFRYAEAQDVYFAMLPAYYHWRMEGEKSWPATFDAQLAVSRDAIHFNRLGGRRPFLRLGPAGSFYSKWVWAFPQPIRMGDELWIYYWGANWDHEGRLDQGVEQRESAITRAVMRLDGFVSADADYSGAVLITPPLVFEGRELELNLDTSAGGAALVEIQDVSGKPVAGLTLSDADELNGNSVEMGVSWKGRHDLSMVSGQPVKLHIRMRSSKLYAFQFAG